MNQYINAAAQFEDNFLGLGNKKKKAEKKVRKAEKQLAKGNIKAAERKLGKAVKKLSQTANPNESATKQKILNTQAKVEQAKVEKEKLIETTAPPVAQGQTQSGEVIAYDTPPRIESPIIPGTGSAMPPIDIPGGGSYQSGGGGGDMPSIPQDEWNAQEQGQREGEDQPQEQGQEEPGKKKNYTMLIIIAIVVVAIFFGPKLFKTLKP